MTAHPATVLPFAGRTDELSVAREAWQAARAGVGSVIVITGEGGIGKSRLAREIAGDARRVLTGRAWEAGGAPPYWMWAEALGPHIGPDAEELRSLLPGLGSASSLALDLAAARFRLFAAVRTWLETASAEEPFLLWFED